MVSTARRRGRRGRRRHPPHMPQVFKKRSVLFKLPSWCHATHNSGDQASRTGRLLSPALDVGALCRLHGSPHRMRHTRSPCALSATTCLVTQAGNPRAPTPPTPAPTASLAGHGLSSLPAPVWTEPPPSLAETQPAPHTHSIPLGQTSTRLPGRGAYSRRPPPSSPVYTPQRSPCSRGKGKWWEGSALFWQP